MSLHLLLFLILIINLDKSSCDIAIIDLTKLEKFEWNGINKKTENFIVSAIGYNIEATINTCDIGRIKKNEYIQYLTISAEGRNKKSEITEGWNFIHIKNKRRLYFFDTNVHVVLYSEKVLEVPCEIIFKISDKKPTTTEAPTSTVPNWPTHDPEVSIYSVVNISGKQINEYKSKTVIDSLKKAILEMVINYTSINGFPLEKNPTTENIRIKLLEPCPQHWPNAERCVQLIYAVPIFLKEHQNKQWSGYQLTKQHLDIMWLQSADSYLPKYNFEVYQKPDILMNWWLSLILFLSLLLIIIMIASNLLRNRHLIKKRIKNATSDFAPKMYGRKKTSDASLSPPYFQTVPPMFDKRFDINRNNVYNEIHNQGQDNPVFELEEIHTDADESQT